MRLMEDCISRQAAKLKVARVIWEDGDSCYDFHDKCVDCLDDVPSAQPDFYDYSDIEPLWESFAKEHDVNLTDGAKQLKDAMWVGYRKGKQDAQPEIIRCKDCRHVRFFDPCFYCYKFGTEIIVSENGFCFMAERKTDG